MKRMALLLLLSVAFGSPGAVEAQRCEGVGAWAEACSRDGVSVTLRRCLPGVVILGTEVEGEPALDVEIARDRPGAFRQVDELGVSPIAEYPDFSEAPEPVQRSFEVVVGCVEADPSLDVPEERLVPGVGGRQGRIDAPLPWLPITALVFAVIAVVFWLRREGPSRKERAIAFLPPIFIFAGTFAIRALLFDPSFVHQNGQGPLWISHALCITPVYGPGYFEVFGLAVRAIGGEPSHALFTIQALLSAAGAAAVWVIARGAKVATPIAAVVTLGVVLEPALLRLAQSESYFATILSLLLLAGAAVSVGARERSIRDPILLLSVGVAGLLIAQAARIHPVAWLPSATIPLVALVGAGDLKGRLRSAALAAVGIGLVATAFAVGVIFDVTGGGVGEQWLPDLFSRIPKNRITWGLSAALTGGVILYNLARDTRAGVVHGVIFFLVVATAFCTHLIGAVGPIIVTAYLLLFLPAFVAALAAGLDQAPRGPSHAWIAAAVLGAAALAFGIYRADGLLELPTDAREQAFVLRVADRLESGATVAFVGGAGPRRRLHLPLYGSCGFGDVSAEAVEVVDGRETQDLSRFGGKLVWYHSSLCDTAEARAYCENIEARYEMTPIAEAELVAKESMEGLGYLEDPVSVGLYRVDERP